MLLIVLSTEVSQQSGLTNMAALNLLTSKMKQKEPRSSYFLDQWMTRTWTSSSFPERAALWSGASWLRSRSDVSASDSKSSWMILTWRPRIALCNGVLPELSKAFTSKTGETYRRFRERKKEEHMRKPLKSENRFIGVFEILSNFRTRSFSEAAA